CQHGYGAPYSF
nr:immunoglobulin light chain junction region [Macaca mulatta]MOV35579.1 immunoglobulin light chain junction region [Macaca mulatta]MOW53228.1 immunoglobulin light chain junction region [Macaca mulatta]MOW55258.1 immunoglobulin light chain junction region [Macaca mulatta]MOX23642.1 immunoglobulin light chain junction region [Macaca mulatta]